MISAQVITEIEDLRPVERRWDELAAGVRAPYCAPVWMLSWWRHCAMADDMLRVIVVRDDADVIGIGPFVANRRRGIARYSLLAGTVSFPTEPLAVPQHRDVVARSLARTLSRIDPRPDVVVLDGAPTTSRWTDLLAHAWRADHKRPHVQRTRALPAPALRFQGRSYEEWLTSKSSNFRQQMGRFRRRLERKGAAFRLATDPTEIEEGLKAFVALHDCRWRRRGGSNLLRPGLHEMLRDVATEFGDPDRFRLWLLEVDGKTICTQIFVQAGGELAYWNGGFDERWEGDRPALQTILAAIEHAARVGDTRVSFGGGGHEYKYRFADHEDVLEWTSILPTTARYPLVRMSLAPDDLRRVISNHMSDATKRRMKGLARRRRPTDVDGP
jgi:CelD/BcsL family acetyltransferase involved in cellulose biosynthesis